MLTKVQNKTTVVWKMQIRSHMRLMEAGKNPKHAFQVHKICKPHPIQIPFLNATLLTCRGSPPQETVLNSDVSIGRWLGWSPMDFLPVLYDYGIGKTPWMPLLAYVRRVLTVVLSMAAYHRMKLGSALNSPSPTGFWSLNWATCHQARMPLEVSSRHSYKAEVHCVAFCVQVCLCRRGRVAEVVTMWLWLTPNFCSFWGLIKNITKL